MTDIPRIRTADEIIQDFLSVPIDKAFKQGHLVSVRSMQIVIAQALKEVEESLGPAKYLEGFKDGYATALEEVTKQLQNLLNAADTFDLKIK